jgi:hypothetical protein
VKTSAGRTFGPTRWPRAKAQSRSPLTCLAYCNHVPVASNRSLIFAQSVSELLAEIEASGGQYRDSHTSVVDDNGTLLVLLTIIYDDQTSDHAGGALT